MAKPKLDYLALLYEAVETPLGIIVEVEPGLRDIALRNFSSSRLGAAEPRFAGVQIRRAPAENEIWLCVGEPRGAKRRREAQEQE